MQAVWIFLGIFCGIFGAAELLRRGYRAIIGFFAKQNRKGGGSHRNAGSA